jgi:hypothetical protein
MIARDTLAGLEMVAFENLARKNVVTRKSRVRSSATGFCHETGGAFEFGCIALCSGFMDGFNDCASVESLSLVGVVSDATTGLHKIEDSWHVVVRETIVPEKELLL